MSDLLELAERCERAEGPDRELDALIHAATIGPQMTVAVGDHKTIQCWPTFDGSGGLNTPYHFTGAAEEAEYALPGPEWPEWQITRRYGTGYHANVGLGSDGVGCCTAALALVSAALRSRANNPGREG
jgi:hypothetical protein